MAIVSVLIALTRLLAVSRSPWDWDEGLFCSALRDFNVAAHHPHPPGFPLFIAAAKFARLFLPDDFSALRAVSVIASMLVFPALYALARALRFPFRSAVIAALLFSFLPNVWYWGGTAFSDVFALVLFLFAAALLFGDDGGARGYLAGSALFAATLLVRPQNLLLGYPWLLATWRRLRARRAGVVAASAALIVVLVLTGYGLAARATGWRSYIAATRQHQKYVATVDGALNPHRPSPILLLREFAVDPFLGGKASILLAAFALCAFLRPRRRDADVLLTFVPNFLLALLMLNPTGVSRLSLGYIPMNALLAADGMAVIAAFIARRRERIAAALETAFAVVIIARFAYWVWPALTEVRTHDSPPMAAVHWIQQHVPRGSRVYVQGGMSPFTEYYLTGYATDDVDDDFDPATAPADPGAYFVADRDYPSPRAVNFRRTHDRLWGLFNRRYFEACVVPVVGGPRQIVGSVAFGDGWYPPEPAGEGAVFRWMGRRSAMALQPLPGTGELLLQFYAPLDAEEPPWITVVFNDLAVERFRVPDANFRKTYRLATGTAPGRVVITVDHAVNPAAAGGGPDTRDLGLRLSKISWKTVLR